MSSIGFGRVSRGRSRLQRAWTNAGLAARSWNVTEKWPWRSRSSRTWRPCAFADATINAMLATHWKRGEERNNVHVGTGLGISEVS